jgi:hypothetical protein
VTDPGNPWAPPGPSGPVGTPQPYPQAPQGWPPPAMPGWPPVAAGPTSRWAIVALVTGILALVPVSVATGIVALVKIRRNQERGTGLAVAGIALGCVWTVIAGLAVLGVLFVNSIPFGDAALGRVADAGSKVVGACLLAPDDQDSYAAATDCSEPHQAEVFAVGSLGDGAWPGYDEIDSQADDLCWNSFDAYVGYDSSSYDYAWFAPDKAEWHDGERRIVCVVVSRDQDHLTGSVRGGSSS